MIKNPLSKAGDTGNTGSTPGLERSPGEGNGSPPQHFFLGNPVDRGARHNLATEQQQIKSSAHSSH